MDVCFTVTWARPWMVRMVIRGLRVYVRMYRLLLEVNGLSPLVGKRGRCIRVLGCCVVKENWLVLLVLANRAGLKLNATASLVVGSLTVLLALLGGVLQRFDAGLIGFVFVLVARCVVVLA